MSYKNRELESKWVILDPSGTDSTLKNVNFIIHQALGSSVLKKVHGRSTDVYWTVNSPGATADFIRVRDVDGKGKLQITVKGKDRGIAEDRLEIDLNLESETSRRSVWKMMNSMFGSRAGEVTKEYYVYWPTDDIHTNISCYKIDGDDRIFVEVEASDTDKLVYWENVILDEVKTYSCSYTKAPGSLYEMFITESVGGTIDVSETKES